MGHVWTGGMGILAFVTVWSGAGMYPASHDDFSVKSFVRHGPRVLSPARHPLPTSHPVGW